MTSSTCSASGSNAPAASTTGTGPTGAPASRSASSKRTHTGTLPFGSASNTSCCSLTELTVGNHTSRAPWRAATSTASGVEPSDRAIQRHVPSTMTPGTASRTTAARSCVAV